MFFLRTMVQKFVFWSLLLLVLVGITGWKALWNNQNADDVHGGYQKDFNYWQGKYKEVAYNLSSDPTVKAAIQTTPIEVKQVTVTQFPLIEQDGTAQQRVDRCSSCHVGLENPAMTAEHIIKDVSPNHDVVNAAGVADYLEKHADIRAIVKVLGAHPGIQIQGEDARDLGVVHSAHLRYGVATESSPTESDKADYQVQKLNLKQHPFPTFGCTTCHYGSGRDLVQYKAHQFVDDPTGDVPEEAHITIIPGVQMLPAKFMDAACAQCHATYNQKTFGIDYLTTAPTASRVIQLLDGKNVADKDVDSYLAGTLLPEDAPAAASSGGPAHGRITHPLTAEAIKYITTHPQMQTIARGEQLFKQQACYGCHKIEGYSKGNIGPELTYEGRSKTFAGIEHQLWDPRYQVETCVMPYFFSVRERNTDDPDPLQLQRDYIDPRTDPKNAQSKENPVQKADITHEDTEESLKRHGYIPDKARQADVDALVTFVASQTGLNYADSAASRYATIAAYNKSVPAEAPVTVAEGKKLFESSGCYACHYVGDPNKPHITGDPKFGRGGISGPELSWEGARHSQEWVIAHYENPQAFVPTSIMPIFPLSNSQRAALSLYDLSHRPAKSGARPVSPDQDMPAKKAQDAGVQTPDVRYMTR